MQEIIIENVENKQVNLSSSFAKKFEEGMSDCYFISVKYAHLLDNFVKEALKIYFNMDYAQQFKEQKPIFDALMKHRSSASKDQILTIDDLNNPLFLKF